MLSIFLGELKLFEHWSERKIDHMLSKGPLISVNSHILIQSSALNYLISGKETNLCFLSSGHLLHNPPRPPHTLNVRCWCISVGDTMM